MTRRERQIRDLKKQIAEVEKQLRANPPASGHTDTTSTTVVRTSHNDEAPPNDK